MEKTPSVKMRKNCMIEFMKERNITIPEPILTKPVLLSLIREERYSEAIYCLQHRQNFRLFSSPGATRSLYVKPYRNGLEPDEATLSATKHLGNWIIESFAFNSRSVQRLRFTEKLGKFFIKCHKGRKKFRKTDRIVLSEVEPVIIKYCFSSESDDSDVEQ